MGAVLLPEDVSPGDAERILRFVNGATDARTLADAVGFAEGREIGLAVAGEILAARRRQGRIASLDGLFGITRVTPARFTELAMALSAARPRPQGRGGSLDVTPALDPAWLGAATALTVARRDARGLPMPGVPVTLVTSWGRLLGQDGAVSRQGAGITVRTGPDGVARLRLSPPLDPPLAPAQQTALDAALGGLPRVGPRATLEAALRALARSYRSGGTVALRAAIDRLCLPEGITPTAPGVAPAATAVTLIAIADAGAGPMTVAGLTVLDWRGAFLGALASAVRTGDRLDGLLGVFDPATAADSRLARGLLAAAAAAESAETATLARRFQPEAAAAALGRFLDSRAEAGAGLDTLASAAGSVVAAGGLKAVAAIEGVQKVRGTGTITADLAGRLEGRLGTLEATVVTRGALDAALDGKADASTLTALGTRLGAAESGLDGLDAQVAAKADAAAVAALDGRLTAAQQGLAGVDGRLAGLADSVTRLDGAVAAKADLDALDTRLDTVDAALGSLRGDLDARPDARTLDALSRRLASAEGALREMDGTVAGLRSRLGQIDMDTLTRLPDALSALDDRVSGLGRSVATLERGTVSANDLAVLRGDVAALRDRTAGLSREVQGTRSALDGVRDDLDGKADARAVDVLRDDLSGLRADSRRIDARMTDIDTRVSRVVINRPLGPLR